MEGKDTRDELGRFIPGVPGQEAWCKPKTEEERDAEGGLARVAKLPEPTPEMVQKMLFAHATGKRTLDREQIACLKLLGELFGLWGAGRKPPATGRDSKSEGFSIKDEAR